MNRAEKGQTVEQLRSDLENVKSAFLVDFRGMKVVDAMELRRQIRKSQGTLKVIKNTLAARVAQDLPLKVLSSYFQGPTAIVYTQEDAVALAKILTTVSKDNPNLVIKAGYVEGALIEGNKISQIASLPTKAALRAQVVGLLASPLHRLMWTLNGIIQKFLVVLSEIKKNRPDSPGGEMKTEEIIKSIEEMSVLQLAQLIKELEEKFGVSAAAIAAPVAAAAGPGTAAAEGEKKEEKTQFDVILTAFPADKKINIIKVVREVTNLGLKEAKDLVEGVPKPLKEGVSKEEVETIKKKFADAGATVEVK